MSDTAAAAPWATWLLWGGTLLLGLGIGAAVALERHATRRSRANRARHQELLRRTDELGRRPHTRPIADGLRLYLARLRAGRLPRPRPPRL